MFLEFGVTSDSLDFIAAHAPAGVTVHGFGSGPVECCSRNVRLHCGPIEESLQTYLGNEVAVGEVALPLFVSFLHLNCGLSSSARIVLRHLSNAIGVGSVIVIDGHVRDGEVNAWDDFCMEHDVHFEWIATERAGASRGLHITAMQQRTSLPPPPRSKRRARPAQAAADSAALDRRKAEYSAALTRRLHDEADAFLSGAVASPPDLLDVDTLGSARPLDVASGDEGDARPFACAVRIDVGGLSVDEGVAQGEAIVREVRASFVRGPVATSARVLRPGAQHFVMWENLGADSIRLQPNKSNGIVWLNKLWCEKSDLDPSSSWPPQRELLARMLPHAEAWTRVLDLAREDGGIDIKDDCRLDDRSARCHQDGNNFLKNKVALVRLAINVSSYSSGRSLDYLDASSDGRFVDGDERERLLVYSVSQDAMWHGAAQTTAGYVQGVTQVCHGSSAGRGPCLKRIITVFALPSAHPLGRLSASQRLQRIGITVRALDPRHQHSRSSGAEPTAQGSPPQPTPGVSHALDGQQQAVLRSSAHRAAWARSRKLDPGPAVPQPNLPSALRSEVCLSFDAAAYDLRAEVSRVLHGVSESVGCFDVAARARRLEDFRVAASAVRGAGGSCEPPQLELATLLAADQRFMDTFARLVEAVVLPHLKARLCEATGVSGATAFYYQCPPTLRLQPGPSSRTVRRHNDREYGHQLGELNYWLPLTQRSLTRTTLWLESHEGADDDHPLEVDYGQIASFHGSACRHHVPANESSSTRVSLDFRVGIEGYFDEHWSMKGTKADHSRRKVVV